MSDFGAEHYVEDRHFQLLLSASIMARTSSDPRQARSHTAP